MLKVLMYLFENYIDRNVNVISDNKTIGLELTRAGFNPTEIDQALAWLQGFITQNTDDLNAFNCSSYSTRVFNQDEQEKITLEARGLLIFLEQAGILNPNTRELVISRLMALEYILIEPADVKWVVLMVLFHQADSKQALALMQEFIMRGEVVH